MGELHRASLSWHLTSCDITAWHHGMTSWRHGMMSWHQLTTFGQENWQRGHVAGGRVNAPTCSFEKDFRFGDTVSNAWPFKQLTSFYPILLKWSQCKFTRRNLEKVSHPISSPRWPGKATDNKIFQKKYTIVKEESCHNILSTRSCFCSSVSDGKVSYGLDDRWWHSLRS